GSGSGAGHQDEHRHHQEKRTPHHIRVAQRAPRPRIVAAPSSTLAATHQRLGPRLADSGPVPGAAREAAALIGGVYSPNHGDMAQFYSDNLAQEVLKGLVAKAATGARRTGRRCGLPAQTRVPGRRDVQLGRA
ncbi:MAG: hypothetical protein LC776_12415, partial [Acidobacteria bacterium]|nr:hypothetical protein [Acidobacteriota bacterium]